MPALANTISSLPKCAIVAATADCDARAFRHEQLGRSESDAAVTAGDQRDVVCKSHRDD
jgi:hypothetical protein